MKGLEISRNFFFDYGEGYFKKNFPEIYEEAAFGLVGQGSECFSFDDEYSRDHDFGQGFMVFLPFKIYRERKDELDRAYNILIEEKSTMKRKASKQADKRVGIFSIEEFYLTYLNCYPLPKNNMEWLNIPEEFLATATNGQVFLDNLGLFTDIRNKLLDFYPDQVVKKKMASYLATASQSGQYNLIRAFKRRDPGTWFFSMYEFLESYISILFLLDKRYQPFYKWKFRALKEWLDYPKTIVDKIEYLFSSSDLEESIRIVEELCVYLRNLLNEKSYVKTKDDFLQVAAEELQNSLEDEELRKMHILRGGLARKA